MKEKEGGIDVLAAITNPNLGAGDGGERTGGHPSADKDSGAESLETLFAEHHGRIFHTAYRITGNATDAEDVLQTVFMRLVKRPGELRLGSGAGAYLHRAAVNAALDMLRARKRARKVAFDEVGDVLAEVEEESPEGRRRRSELREWLRRGLARLSPRASEIFTLRYIAGYGNKEIAELLDTSQTAVGVILHRSRNRLQKELAPLLGGTS